MSGQVFQVGDRVIDLEAEQRQLPAEGTVKQVDGQVVLVAFDNGDELWKNTAVLRRAMQLPGGDYSVQDIQATDGGLAFQFTADLWVCVAGQTESQYSPAGNGRWKVTQTGPAFVKGAVYTEPEIKAALHGWRINGGGIAVAVSSTTEYQFEPSPAENGWCVRDIRPKIKVLFLDDKATNRNMVEASVGFYGIAPTTLASGYAVLDAAKRGRVNVIFLDLDLSDAAITGWDVARWLADSPDTKNIPVIILTSSGKLEDQARANNMGIAFLRKPFSPVELATAIERATGRMIL